jgi:hypothetical protein
MPLDNAGKPEAVRRIALRRRRSRVPWIYVVYHARRTVPAATPPREDPQRMSPRPPPAAEIMAEGRLQTGD